MLTKPTGRSPQARRFYIVNPDFRRTSSPGFRIENEKTLKQGMLTLGPATGCRGFPNFPEIPRIVIDRKLGLPPRDLEEYSAYWLISDRLKTVLEAVDLEAFDFARCDVRIAGSGVGPVYWLCDVVRVIDAVDEAASKVTIRYYEGDYKTYSLAGGASLVLREDVVGPAHIFRMAHLEPTVICDQIVRDACKTANLKGITFRDATNY